MTPIIIGKATLYNMDCMDLLKATPDKFYELAIVDPPYGIGAGSVNFKSGTRKSSNFHKVNDWDKSAPNQEYFGENTYGDGELAWTSFSSPIKKYEQFWSGSNAKEKDQVDRIHPTQKPIKLYEWLLTNYAKPNDKILDTHLGSGSHAIACNNLGFELTACELDKDYFDASVKRITQANKQIRMFE
jgi:site-specific DNA-methyltransferase (adenine-specific)